MNRFCCSIYFQLKLHTFFTVYLCYIFYVTAMSYECTEGCRRNHRAPRVNINTHCLAHITASLFVLMTSKRSTFPDCFRSESCCLYYHTMPGFDLKPSPILSGRQHSADMLFVDKTLRILTLDTGWWIWCPSECKCEADRKIWEVSYILVTFMALCNPAATPRHHSQHSPAGLGSEGLVPCNSQHLTLERISLLQTLLISGCVVYSVCNWTFK